jgi:hypothetical protein
VFAAAGSGARRGVPLGVLRSCVPVLLAGLVVVAFLMFEVRRATPSITGDEPSYLVFADALRHGTVDVRAAQQDPSGTRRWLPTLSSDQTVIHDGHMRSMRMPLLPLLLIPAMMAGSLLLARLIIVAFAVALLDQLWRLLGDLGYRGLARAGPWLAVLTGLPVLGYATHIYPEMPGALGIVVVLRLLLRPTRRPLVAASTITGLLPWLILRFSVLAIALAAVAVVLAAWPRRCRLHEISAALRERWRDVVIVASPFIASIVAYACYIRVLYGTFDPRATYPSGFTQAWTPWHAYVEGIGSVFGAGEGLIPYAPAFVVGLIGAVLAARRYHRMGWFLLAVAAIHLFVVVPTGFWGLALPGRFVIVLVPFLAIAIAEAMRVSSALKIVVVALVAAQLVIIGLYHDINVLILDRVPRYTYLALFPAVDDEPGLTSFGLPLTKDPGPVAYVDDGSLRADHTLGAGTIYNSPDLALRPGHYAAAFRLASLASPPSNVDLARITISQMPSGHLLAERSLLARDLTRPIDLNFTAPGQPVTWTNRVVITVDSTGITDLELRSISGGPTTPLPPRDHVIHHDIPLSVAWISASALSAGLLFLAARRKRLDPGDSATAPTSRHHQHGSVLSRSRRR